MFSPSYSIVHYCIVEEEGNEIVEEKKEENKIVEEEEWNKIVERL